jgi:hypothetical protein
LHRKRKLVDKSVPNAVLQNPDFAADSRMYQDLLEMERRLDWTMMRKKVEVQDALARNPTVCFSILVDDFNLRSATDNANLANISQPYSLGTDVANCRWT